MQLCECSERTKGFKEHWFYYITNHRGVFLELWYQIIGVFGSFSVHFQSKASLMMCLSAFQDVPRMVSRPGLASDSMTTKNNRETGDSFRQEVVAAQPASCVKKNRHSLWMYLSNYTSMGAQEGGRMSSPLGQT